MNVLKEVKRDALMRTAFKPAILILTQTLVWNGGRQLFAKGKQSAVLKVVKKIKGRAGLVQTINALLNALRT
jgi:hypothetical protein